MNTKEYNDTLHTLAYESIKASELWETCKTNAECDEAADELAAAIRRTIDSWIGHRVGEKVEGERLEALVELTKVVISGDGPATVFPLEHPRLRSLTEAQSARDDMEVMQ